MTHNILKAMADRDAQYKLVGLVEVGGSSCGPYTSRIPSCGAEHKPKLIIDVSVLKDEDGEERPGFAHTFFADDASAETIGSVLHRLGVPDDEITPLIDAIRIDGWQSYRAVAKGFGLVHHRVSLSDPKDSMKLLPLTHQLIANAKSMLSGPHRGVSTEHLQSYLSEVCYRFN
jgi:hypothetical protein